MTRHDAQPRREGLTINPLSHKPELLAPAGGFEQLAFALHFGADAVYLGGTKFGMRTRADNFTDEELPAAVQMAHDAGAQVHVTVNVLMHEDDLSKLPAYLHLVEEAGADAVIVGDLATIDVARRETPSLEIHVSTQMSCANSQAANLYHSLGAKRVVLARELTLSEIAAIRRATNPDLELEVFVHGAMCMAWSGRCLISNHLNGRDANRGHCTQPCRWTYTLEEEKRPGVHFPIEEDASGSFILSSKDLMMLDHLDELAEAGVDSIKLEGRVKGAYYVATVVNAYRQVLDGAPAADFLPELDAVSHRPYHTGFFYGKPDQSHEAAEYAQNRLFVGTVVDCRQGSVAQGTEDIDRAGSYRVKLVQRNRFERGDELEVLSPGCLPRAFTVEHLYTELGQETAAASKTCEVYELECPYPLQPQDILRKRL